MNFKTTLISAALVAAGLAVAPAHAQSVTEQMPVTITIENACDLSTSPTTLDFGTQGVLAANVDAVSTIAVTCTTSAPYDIGLDGGGSGDINARVMTNGSDEVAYQLYQEAGRTTVWGNTVDVDTVEGTGSGTEQYLSVYGRVPAQATPPAGVYNDTVLVTATY